MYSNPASSAVRATVASSRPSPSGPRGVLKSGICSPTFMVITSRAYSLTQKTAAAPGRPAEGAAVTTRADLIIVGAGLAGAAAAWAASARGLDVVVLEAFGPGHRNGSSHGSARIFRRAYPDPLYVRLTGAAGELWRQLEDQAGERLLTLTGGIDFGGTRDPGRLHEVLTSCGVPAELLDPQAGGQSRPYFHFARR